MSSYEAYPEYRDGGVEWLGDVPNSWRVKKLKFLANVFPSNVDKKTIPGEPSVSLCNYTDVYYNDEIISKMKFMAASATEEQIEKFTLLQGDTIITKDSEDPSDIAVPAYVPMTLPGVICGYHLSVIRPFVLGSSKYINYLFKATYARAYFHTRSNGLTRYGLGSYALLNVSYPVPETSEASAIANFLDHETAKIDTLIEKQQQLIKLLKEKRQAVISHAVTKGLNPDAPMKDSGVEWLGEVPAHWRITRLKYSTYSIEQGWSPQCSSSPASGNEYGVLKVGCVNDGVFDVNENKALPTSLRPLTQYSLKKNDLLISRANTKELVGSAAVVQDDYNKILLCDKLYRIRFKEGVDPQFIAFYMKAPVVRQQIELGASGASSSMQNIGQSTILEMEIPILPADELSQLLSYLDAAISTLGLCELKIVSQLKLLQERRTALISAAVTGKIDVRNWQPPKATSTLSTDA